MEILSRTTLIDGRKSFNVHFRINRAGGYRPSVIIVGADCGLRYYNRAEFIESIGQHEIDRMERMMIEEIQSGLKFSEYARQARETAIYPDQNGPGGMIYTALKLAGEAGEVAEKIGKMLRDDNLLGGESYSISEEQRKAIAKELGDVLWYIAAMSSEIGITMEEIAAMNIAKLRDRQERNALRGSGDER